MGLVSHDAGQIFQDGEDGIMSLFTVIDKQTGTEPDTQRIALNEDWADGLIYCDMEGFAVEQDGTLMLLDECGNFRYCPPGRFLVCLNTEES